MESSEDHHRGEEFRNDKYFKQKRRGSGLGGIANYFKASIKGRLLAQSKEDGGGDHDLVVPSQVSTTLATATERPPEDSSRSSDKEKSSSSSSDRSPMEFLDVMWRSRGYSRDLYYTLETAYFNSPSPLQVASYHENITKMVREEKVVELRALLASGLSNNPSNEKGESLVHEVCRAGSHTLLSVLMHELDATVQISNDSGQTPLHHACVGGPEGPYFAVVDLLAACDRRMFSLKDDTGKTPLEYIPLEQWGAWIDFLYVRRDVYWPRRLVKVDAPEPDPPLTLEAPRSRCVSNPSLALTPEVAAALVVGEITVEQVAQRQEEKEVGQATTDSTTATGTTLSI